jgi:hypothetical protein
MMDVGEITANDDDGCRKWGGMYAEVVTTDTQCGQESSVSNALLDRFESVFFSPREDSTAGIDSSLSHCVVGGETMIKPVLE